MENKTFCEICCIEVNITLLYNHINSKEHKEIEHYLIKRCLSYCKVCKEQIKKDEWKEHVISENHLELAKQDYCNACQVKYSVSGYGDKFTSYKNRCIMARVDHNLGKDHKHQQFSN